MNHARNWRICLALAGALTLAGCSSARKAPSVRPDAAPPMGAPTGAASPDGGTYGPEPAPEAGTYGPEPVQTQPIVLVLGPGLARGFAHVGVLRALSDAKIPIGAIVASDMGAVIASVYATSGTINAFEFSLLHLKGEYFYEKPGVLAAFRRKKSDGDALRGALTKVVGGKEFKDARVPLKFAIHRARTGDDTLAEQGSLAQAARAAAANPLFMEDGQWAGVPARSTVATRPYPVAEAKALNAGMVVVVDTLGDLKPPTDAKGDGQAAYQQLKQARARAGDDLAAADLVITPQLRGVGALDFTRRSEAVFQGKAAVQRRIKEIRQLVGLPAEGLATE